MTAAYVPVKGDRVRHTSWADTEWLDVLCVGGQQVFGIDADGDEWSITLIGDWIKVETPPRLPERWVNLTTRGLGNDYGIRADADEVASSSRLAVLHIWTDSDGEDHAEIERVAP